MDIDIYDDDQDIVLVSDYCGTIVPLAEIEDFLLPRRYSPELLAAVADGKI